MAITIPYLIFNGEAKEAMDYYAHVFNMKQSWFEVYSDMPQYQNDATVIGKVSHGRLALAGEDLLYFEDTLGEQTTTGTLVNLSFQFQDEETIQAAYQKMTEKSTIQVPIGKAPWGATYAQLTDRFGIQWKLNYHPAD